METTERDISTAFRIPPGRNEKHSLIVVLFATRRVREAAFRTRKGPRGYNEPPGDAVYVIEHLTKGNVENVLLALDDFSKRIASTSILGELCKSSARLCS